MKLATTFQFTGDPAKTAQQVKDYESAGIDVESKINGELTKEHGGAALEEGPE